MFDCLSFILNFVHMNNEIVIFTSVYRDNEEAYEQISLKESQGIKPPFHNENDYIDEVAIDLNQVTGWEVGTISFNGDMLDCIFAELEEPNLYSRNLLIDKKAFKTILEYVQERPIFKAGDYLKQIKDGDTKEIN